MADSKKKTSTAPIIDVAHPDKTAPSTTSKPVIITNRPIMQDTMVVNEDKKTDSSDDQPEQPVKTTGSSKPKLQPLASSPTPSEINPEVTEKPAPAAIDKADKPATAAPEEAEPAKPAEPEAQEPSPESAEAEAKAAEPALADQDAEAAEQAERDQQLQKIADSKEFYLPINSVEQRKTKHFVVLGLLLSLLLIIAWADIALDAGLIQLGGIHPITHFFSN